MSGFFILLGFLTVPIAAVVVPAYLLSRHANRGWVGLLIGFAIAASLGLAYANARAVHAEHDTWDYIEAHYHMQTKTPEEVRQSAPAGVLPRLPRGKLIR